MQWNFKYLISSFIVVVCCLQQYCRAQSTTVRPYKFGFTIEEQQHRYEKRDERGIVMGEFGFITADGIYHVTVYATDEQGRFRILAMKNYPYESPPKTIEVMVKPKVITTTTTTTTEKPVLVRHNFNTEACSGCFLKNGNNKPKSSNGVDNKNVQGEIRPLSKSLPSTPGNGARQPGLAGTQSKTASNNPGNKGKSLNTSDTLSKSTTKLNKSVTTQNVATQKQHVAKPTTVTLPKSLSTNVAKPHETQSHNSQHISTVKVNKNNNQQNIFDSNTKSVIQNLQNPLKTKTNNILHNTLSNTKAHHRNTLTSEEAAFIPAVVAYIIETTTKQPSLTSQHVTKQHQHVAKTTPVTLPKSLATNVAKPTHSTQSHDTQHISTAAVNKNKNQKNVFASTTKSSSENRQNPLKTKTNNILHNSPSNTVARYGNTLISAESGHVHTATTKIIENPSKQPSLTHNKGNTPIPTTTHTNTGNTKSVIKQTPIGHGKQYTTPTLSKDTNPTTTRPQGSPGLNTKANTPTGKTPPIMDIIVNKVLPTLMGSKGKSPTLNSKPSAAPSGSSSGSPGSTKPLIPGSNSLSNPQSRINKGNSIPSSVNGDGDLYRFKYILDYHGHTETGKRNGNKEGNYFVIGDDDVERTIEYVANENGYQPRIRWRKLNKNEIKSKENTLKDYEFVWFTQ